MAVKSTGTAYVRLIVEAGKATPSPPVGPALGARGVKAIDFCKLFNAQTAHIETSTPMRVKMKIESDRSFKFEILSPPTSYLLMRCLSISKGSSDPNRSISTLVGQISLKYIYQLALIKSSDPGMSHIPIQSISRSIVTQAKNMGIRTVP
ncbi:ribosomal protein L11, N-terminal domain-domain-containing protein [Phakopsora pachyrhizi]|uniref:Ribosomal protein L11, N-terminal domain-domain-containing protein n=1 Tax=Phakopsora pachyrhizi TaxID=170000 RepID=A0AAV0B1W2_PHAPC|nr:ribosomal protein L11, N-terminal domain-domain-containing protein [Phakopsora pachyrhizi]